MLSASRIQQGVECLLGLQCFPHIPNRCVGIRTVETYGCDLLANNPVLNPRTMYSGIAGTFVKKQINLVGKDGGEIVDVRFPVAVESGGKDDPAVVIEYDKAQVMDCGYPIRVLLAFASESIGQQLPHAFRASWLERADQRELVRLSCLVARTDLGDLLHFRCCSHSCLLFV